MTQIQNNRRQNMENERANAASEKIASARDAETARHNAAQEKQQKDALKEQKRANKASELFKQEELDYRRKAAVGQAIGNVVGGIGTAALLFNDIKWYVKDKATADSILNLPSKDALGTQYPIGALNINPSDQPQRHLEYSGPSILSMVTVPTVGVSRSLNSAINRAASKLWIRANEKNGRNSSYADADMMMYQIGVSGLLMLEAYLERLYDWANKYSSTDSSLPRGMIYAMGMDFDDIKKNRYQLHSLIEDLREFISTYRLVPEFNIANRWYFSMKTALTDVADPERPQWYLYTPGGFPRLDLSGTETKIVLEGWVGDNALGGNKWNPKHTFDELYDLVSKMQASFFTAQDVKIMNSDIIAAFGEDATKPFGSDKSYPFNSLPSISTDSTALFQFRNAKPASFGFAPSSYEITEKFEVVNPTTQAKAAYVYSTAPGFAGDDIDLSSHYDDGVIIEVGNKQQAAEFLIEETRLIPARTTALDGGGLNDAFFAESPVGMIMVRQSLSTNPAASDYGTIRLVVKEVAMSSNLIRSDLINDRFEALALGNQLEASFAFRYAPIRKLSVMNGDNQEPYQHTFLTSTWENTVWVPLETLRLANNRIALRMLGAIE